MSFVSSTFYIFLAVCTLCFYCGAPRLRKPMLLVASYIFYASWSLPFAAVLLLSTSLDLLLSRGIARSNQQSQKRLLMWFGVIVNLLVLCVFKYNNFFLSTAISLGSLLHTPPTVMARFRSSAFGNLVLHVRSNKLSCRCLSWRSTTGALVFRIQPLYIMYFPHLVSGPIVRFKQMASQISGDIAPA